MQISKILLSVLFASFFLTSCIYSGHVEERSAKARSILKADKVLVISSVNFPLLVSDKTTPLWGVKKPDYDEGRHIMASYEVTNPISGVIDTFLQSLPRGVVQGEIIYPDASEIDLRHLNGWISFVGSSWELEKIPFAGYRFNYSVYVKVLHNTGMVGRDGQIFIATLWQKECLAVKPGVLKGHPLNIWLEDNAVLLKDTITDIQMTCGQQLAQDLVKFLEF